MRNATRAALALGLGLVGVAGLVVPSMGQQQANDGAVRAAANNTGVGSTPKTPAPAPAAVIGVIDLNIVARNYDKQKVASEKIQTDAMARSNEIMKLQGEGASEMEKLKRLTPGSPDQKRIEDKLSELKVKIQTVKEQAQVEFERREAEIYAATYNDIQRMAQGVAKQRGMNMILQYSSTPISANDPNSLQMSMIRSVVMADPKVDITNDVVYWLNKFYKESGGPAPKGNAPAAAPAAAAAPAGGVQR